MEAKKLEMEDCLPESGSFRDRSGRVFYYKGQVLRALSPTGLECWNLVKGKEFFNVWTEQQRLVPTKDVQFEGQIPFAGEWKAVIEHQRVPFVSYPYEWCFGQLKDAAILQLELLIASLAEDIILKDATPYNIQWYGRQPVFIDILSFEQLRDGQVWVGYRQFCELFLYPLMLQAYKQIPFQWALRGELEGLSPQVFCRLLSFGDIFRRGVLKHVVLHSKLQDRFSSTNVNIKGSLSAAGFSKELILMNLRSLLKLVRGLCLPRQKTQWSDYAEDCPSYTEDDFKAKVEVLEKMFANERLALVWDLGCNSGFYSRLVSKYSQYVIGIDADYMAIEYFYDRLKTDGPSNVLPLIGNVAQPSPAIGWQGRERKRLEDRGKPDLIIALALIHHVVITSNIPLREFVEQLAIQGRIVIIEFVTREDPMVKKLLLNKEDQYSDYTLECFEGAFAEFFGLQSKVSLPSGTRVIYKGYSKLFKNL